jgi:hypothetical protein
VTALLRIADSLLTTVLRSVMGCDMAGASGANGSSAQQRVVAEQPPLVPEQWRKKKEAAEGKTEERPNPRKNFEENVLRQVTRLAHPCSSESLSWC